MGILSINIYLRRPFCPFEGIALDRQHSRAIRVPCNTCAIRVFFVLLPLVIYIPYERGTKD